MDEDRVLLSVPVAKETFAVLTVREFDAICREIEGDDALVAELEEYRGRWIEVNLSDDDLAFAGLPDGLAKLDEIIGRVSSDPSAQCLTVSVLLRYLGLR